MRRGVMTGIAAYVGWGFFPLYFKLLAPASAGEILAHRIIWSAVFMAVLLAVLRRYRFLRALARDPRRLAGVGLPALLIGGNWFAFIVGVATSHVVEVSLGYFITPLVSVLLGVAVLRERLRRAQWTAVSIGTMAVVVLAAEYGGPPWLALLVALTFSLYGLVKKRQGLPAADGLLVETAALLPPALGYVAFLMVTGEATVGHVSAGHTLLILLAGALTALPLMSFAYAANRVPLTTLGVLQYITPILHLGFGVLVFHEPMPPARLAAFALVWLALAVFTWDALHARAVTRRLRGVDGRRPPTPAQIDVVDLHVPAAPPRRRHPPVRRRGRVHAQAAEPEAGMKLRYANLPRLHSLPDAGEVLVRR
jgi:chloramphenicol-sensitive protein RarD